MSERYHLGGRVETDTVAMAAARQDQAGIQRRHRFERRHGDDPSQTPPFISLVARHEISQGTEEPPPQQPLQSAPALSGNQPRRGRPRLPDDPAQPVINFTSLKTSLGVDVPVYPKVLVTLPSPKTNLKTSLGVDVLLYPMILSSLGLDVLVYLMHRHRIELRIELPQVTLCPRHTGR